MAQWVAKTGRPAGAGTDSLPGARLCYIPISSRTTVLAVAGLDVSPGSASPLNAADSKNIVLALAGECAMAVEKERLARANADIAVRAQQEKLRADVLRSVSHDLRTPLTAICGNAAMLAAGGDIEMQRRKSLARAIEEDARYLVEMVENLLALTRLEQYGFTLRLAPELMEDIIREALAVTRRRAAAHNIRVDMADALLMARMDARLMVQVLVNLLDNAVKYTPAGTTIRISAQADGARARLEVADNGPGISAEEKTRIFDMFHSAVIKKGDSRRGMGVGLALCRSIVQAHGGDLRVHDNTPRGAVFSLDLQREIEEGPVPESLRETPPTGTGARE